MKNFKNTQEKYAREEWTQIFATDISFMFACTGNSITKIEEVKENKAGHFLFLSNLSGRFLFTGSNL